MHVEQNLSKYSHIICNAFVGEEKNEQQISFLHSGNGN